MLFLMSSNSCILLTANFLYFLRNLLFLVLTVLSITIYGQGIDSQQRSGGCATDMWLKKARNNEQYIRNEKLLNQKIRERTFSGKQKQAALLTEQLSLKQQALQKSHRLVIFM